MGPSNMINPPPPVGPITTCEWP